jgi:hypothetical protein
MPVNCKLSRPRRIRNRHAKTKSWWSVISRSSSLLPLDVDPIAIGKNDGSPYKHSYLYSEECDMKYHVGSIAPIGLG